MKENKYDEKIFFDKYSQMDRSRQGLQAAGEWPELQKLLPDFTGKRVLDLGCGYGWHCRYAAEQRAAWVLGTDISHKMLDVAHARNPMPNVEYRCAAMEDLNFAPESFDVILSSLAFHYVSDFEQMVQKIAQWLIPGGELIFSTEHPVFTAYGTQDWYYAPDGKILHFPVDRYFEEGPRQAIFLGEAVTKYHRTLTTYLETLLQQGFVLQHVVEPQPPESMRDLPGMQEEWRRPMMLLISARKNES